jgi:uncharacterized protein (DUF433 family)
VVTAARVGEVSRPRNAYSAVMATQQYRIVSAADSEIHEEPHIEGSRVTVHDVYMRVEQRGLDPERVAERYNLDIADIYEALAYYHTNPEEMRQVEQRHERAAAEAKQRSSLTPPEN